MWGVRHTFLFPQPTSSLFKMTRTKNTRKTSRKINRRRHRYDVDLSVKINDIQFQQMVKQVVKDIYGVTMTGGTHYCFQSDALRTLQDAAESFLEDFWNQIRDIANHAGRERMIPSDVDVWYRTTNFKVKHPKSSMSLCSLFNSLPPKKRYDRKI